MGSQNVIPVVVFRTWLCPIHDIRFDAANVADCPMCSLTVEAVTTLAMPLDAEGLNTVVALQDAKSVKTGDVLKVDDELMSITDASDPNNPHVVRAVEGSTAAFHAVGTPVVIAG